MSYKPSYQTYKKSRRRRQNLPVIILVIAVIVMIVGIFMIYLSLSGGAGRISLFVSPTPSATASATPLPPTETPTITPVPSETPIPSETPLPTPAEPFVYTVQSGDSLFSIAEQFGVDYVAIMLLNGLTNDDAVSLFPGDVLTIPNPDMGFPTPTPLPANLGRGAIIKYFVLSGDSLRTIAEEFLTTVEDIIDANEFDDPDAIYPGQIINVPVNLITPTFGPPNTPTLTPTDENVPTPSSTPAG
jgi:LysM repeat protein